jgi:secreted PhoX family phosphatase
MGMVLALALGGCGRPTAPPEAPAPPTPAPRTIRFAPVVAGPELATTKTPIATRSATVDGVEVPIDFHVVHRAGQDGFGDVHRLDGTRAEPACSEADNLSLLAAGGRPWLVTHFECPAGALYLTELSRDEQGVLAPIGTKPIPFERGVWNPCAGAVSPWGTHIGSEEYEPNAQDWDPETGGMVHDDYGAWADLQRIFADPKAARPYDYGYATEVAVGADGTPTSTKHPALGRFSHEVSLVLPDGRTVYQSDDGHDTGFFLFVADRAGDLSAGKLYAAALEQRSDTELGVTWVPLGHATDAQIDALVDAGVRFDDLLELRPEEAEGTCPLGSSMTRHSYGRGCLQLRPPSEKVPDPALAASRLETRRYASMLGATMELEKGEGVAFDPETNRVFLALSSQAGPMIAEPEERQDVIRLPKNPCGAVFAADTAAGVLDRDGQPIDSPHVATSLRIEVQGRPLAEPDAAGNRCDPGGIANPDNLTFLPGYGQLVIAEDTRAHVNAVLWTWDVRTRELVPVMVAPHRGEMTGIQWIPDLLGHAYLTVVVQHPWAVKEPPAGVTPDDQRAFVGYLGPFPSLR